MNIVGPVKKNGVRESLQYLKTILKKGNINSIFINRYAQDILLELSDDILKSKKKYNNWYRKQNKKINNGKKNTSNCC